MSNESPKSTIRISTETESAGKMGEKGLGRYQTPYRVGCVMDSFFDTAFSRDFYDATLLAFDEALANGVLDRPIELIVREVEGLPYGEYRSVLKAWQELVDDERCIAMIGPIASEN